MVGDTRTSGYCIVKSLALIRLCLGLFPFVATFFSCRFLALLLVEAAEEIYGRGGAWFRYVKEYD